jgi:selenocysteine-specific elongation factor
MLICTAGHVDHGKTALVKALSGVDTDRLPEEKRRGMTLDLGYAYTDRLGFVDVPGHERLVHTMLAGASGIDAALLVVAADDGVMPQTSEHLAILELLGIDRGVIAISKIDLAPSRVAPVSAALHALLAGSPLATAPIVPVSARTGEGIEALGAALHQLSPRARDLAGHPRLAVDRAFTLTGAGIVVTGTVVAGRIALDDRLLLSPSGLELRVRGLHAQGRPANEAIAGQRAALNITGPRLSKELVARGDWVLHPDLHAPATRLDVKLRLLPGAAIPRPDTHVHLHLGAAHALARITPLDADRLPAGGTAFVRLTLERGIGALAGDRVVIRDAGASSTIGGGVVVDPFGPLRGRRSPLRLDQLTALDTADPSRALGRLLAIPPWFIDLEEFARARNLPAALCQAVMTAASAAALGPVVIAAPGLVRLSDAVADTLRAYHKSAPDQPGLTAERLRLELPVRLPQPAMRALLGRLTGQGALVQDGPWLRLPAHRVTLSVEDERLWSRARPLIEAEPHHPPRTRDLARTLDVPEPVMRAALKRLQRAGRLTEIATDLFFLRETVAHMAALAVDLADSPQGLTAGGFRDRLENGRKAAIQVLEFFDRAGLTARAGEIRRIRRDRLEMFGSPHPASDRKAGDQ